MGPASIKQRGFDLTDMILDMLDIAGIPLPTANR
jgi:hypothetical protein